MKNCCKKAAAIMGAAGGKKSRRVLTTEQSKAMLEIREANRKAKEEERAAALDKFGDMLQDRK